MSTQANLRNGDANDGPTIWSTATHEYVVVIRLDWTAYVGKHPLGSASTEDWETFELADIPGNPLELPIKESDTHHRLCIAVDADGYVHISGNQHNSKRKYVKTTVPGDITTFANASNLIDSSAAGLDNSNADGTGPYSYNLFEADNEGGLYWYFLQTDRDTSPRVCGRDALLFYLAPGETVWVPAAGTVNGEIMICDETVGNGDPERVYCINFIIDADNTIHWFGVWQDDHADGNTRGELFYMRRPGGTSQWETITGEPLTLPLERADIQATTYGQIPDQFSTILSGWQMTLDSNGYPHVVVTNESNGRRRHYWDGAAWQSETPVSGNRVGMGHMINLRSVLWFTRTTGNQVLLRNFNQTVGPYVRLSGSQDNSFFPMPDPVRRKQGVFVISAPDGDLPRTYSFGSGPRMTAS